MRFGRRLVFASAGASAWSSYQMRNLELARDMEPASYDGMPNDVLIVEDDPIIALDFEDTILGFGVKLVRTAANVAKALNMIAERPPATWRRRHSR